MVCIRRLVRDQPDAMVARTLVRSWRGAEQFRTGFRDCGQSRPQKQGGRVKLKPLLNLVTSWPLGRLPHRESSGVLERIR